MNVEDIKAADAGHTHSYSRPCSIAILLERIDDLEDELRKQDADYVQPNLLRRRIAELEKTLAAREGLFHGQLHARIAELEGESDHWQNQWKLAAMSVFALNDRITELQEQQEGWEARLADVDEVRVWKLEAVLRAIAKGKDWASNGYDSCTEFRLSRRAMKADARRALGEDA